MIDRYSTEQLVTRWEDRREIKNIMSKHAVSFLIKKEDEILDTLWSSRDDICLGVNEGWYDGRDAVKSYYDSFVQRNIAVRDVLMELFPEKVAGKTPEELYGIGVFDLLSVTNGVVEIADDGETAKGMWFVFGKPIKIDERGPVSHWIFGTYCADFVKEGDAWKLWHLTYLRDIDNPTGADWSIQENPYPELPEFAKLKDVKIAAPNKPMVLRELYSKDRPFTKLPPIPEPYETFADTFSYGV